MKTPHSMGHWLALGLSVLMHVLLGLFLFLGVSWQTTPKAPMTVELVAAPGPASQSPSGTPAPPRALPKPEAPKPPPPKPEPPKPEPPKPPPPKPEPPKPEPPKPAAPKPDIATQAPKPEPKPEPPKPPPPKPEPKPEPPKPPPPKPEPKPEPPKPPPPKPEPKPEPPKPPPPKPEPKPAPKPPEPDTLDDLERLIQQQHRAELAEQTRLDTLLNADSRGAGGGAATSRGDLSGYIGRVAGKIRSNVILPPGLVGNPQAEFVIDQLPDGTVTRVRLAKSSGNAALDDAMERAILRSSPLPLPDAPARIEPSLRLIFRPLEN
jgi:colicin import membrane protein